MSKLRSDVENSVKTCIFDEQARSDGRNSIRKLGYGLKTILPLSYNLYVNTYGKRN